jgi:ADP-heptose:LPS heptosyltransferase
LPARTKPLKAIYFDGRSRRMLKSQQPFDLLLDLRSYRDMGDPVAASRMPARTKVALRNAYLGKFVWVPLPAEGEIYDVLLALPSAVPGGSTQDIENHRRLAEFLFPNGPECRNALPRLTISGADRAELAQFLEKHFAINGGVPFLLVCPGTSSPIKEYPIDALAGALRQTLAEHALPVVIAGSAQDARTIEPLVAALSAFAKVTAISGTLDLARHVTLIAMAAALLPMDSCYAHIAGAVGTPAVVVLGRGQYDVFGPWGESPTFRWLASDAPASDLDNISSL